MNNSDTGSSLLDHLDALRTTLLWSLGAAAVMAVPGIIFTLPLLMRYVAYVCPPGMELHYFTPFEPLIVQLELGLLTGVVAALPVILMKFGTFIAPGLYAHEKRWILFFTISSAILMIAGAALALGVVVPIVMEFSGTFAASGLKPVIGLGSFLKMSALLATGFAVVFEIPVALLLAIRMGIIKVESLQKHRAMIVVILFAAAAILTPPDIISQLLMGIPGWLLFEATLLIGKRIVPKENAPECENGESEYICRAAEDPGSAEKETSFTDDYSYRHAGRKKRRIRHL